MINSQTVAFKSVFLRSEPNAVWRVDQGVVFGGRTGEILPSGRDDVRTLEQDDVLAGRLDWTGGAVVDRVGERARLLELVHQLENLVVPDAVGLVGTSLQSD